MRLTWLTGCLALALFAGLAVQLAPLQPNIVALQFAFTPADFQAVLALWGPAGVTLYRSHFPADFALLALYGSFGGLLVTRSRTFDNLPGAGRSVAAVLLPLAAVCDAGENLLHLTLTTPAALAASPDAALVAAAAVCATGKWVLLAGFAAMAARAEWRRRRKP